MNIARPPNGFVLRVKPRVIEILNALSNDVPWLGRAYKDAVTRLVMSGHKEGRQLKSNLTWRVAEELDPLTGVPRLAITYQVSADVLTIHGIIVLVADNQSSEEEC